MANVDLTRIASNIGALNSLMSLDQVNKQLSTHQTRLASGKRINSAADDPAGLTIATKLQSRSEGLKVALGNIADAKNLLSVAEAGIGRINEIILEMRNKVEQGASDTLGVSERESILQQLRSYVQQVNDIVQQTEWNGNKLINGTYEPSTNPLTFQTGASSADTTLVYGLKDLSATTGSASLNLGFQQTTTPGSGRVSNPNGILASGSTPLPALTAPGTSAETTLYQVKISRDNAGVYSAELLDAASNRVSGPISPVATNAANVAFPNYFTVPLSGDLTVIPANSYKMGAVGYTKLGDFDVTTAGGDLATGDYMTTAKQFNTYMAFIESKMNTVNQQLALVGAYTGRLTFKEDQVINMQINVEASYSRIMNANMAEEQVNASKYQILQQTATAMLAQANQAPQFILQLFK
jgi:flagellin